VTGTTQNGAVTTVRIDYSGGNNEHTLFLASDLHVDAVSCNRDVLLADMQEAVNRNAMIFLIGDIFDAMQGRFDPRRSLDELRPEYRRQDYYDFVVKDVARILGPFAKNIVLISDGNHETATLKNANLSLTDRLIWLLNTQYGGNVQHGGYGGWVRFMLEGNSGGRASVKMKYFHGAGGDSPVTRGVIQTNRQAVYLNGADIVVNGHNHNAYYVPIVQESVSDSGKVIFSTQHHVRTPGYKSEYNDGTKGWAVEKGMVPKPLGGAFVNLKVTTNGKAKRVGCQIGVQPVIHEPVVMELW
jgi:hypothetical protein